MERPNIAELLKDCPKGMELDCTMYDNVTFDCVLIDGKYPINVNTPVGSMTLTEYGQCFDNNLSKCVIFPKGKTTWKGFVPPYQFKNGDVIVDKYGAIAIYKKIHTCYTEPYVDFYCGITSIDRSLIIKEDDSIQHCGHVGSIRLANKEEKQELFQAIKERGYQWNSKTKTLEKLTKLKFKIGETITNGKTTSKIRSRDVDSYQLEDGSYVFFNEVHKWTSVPNKFDIANLKDFDKVLVRDNDRQEWIISFFSHCNGSSRYKYSCINGAPYAQCIPYKGNEHLKGKIDDCNEFYKTWI